MKKLLLAFVTALSVLMAQTSLAQAPGITWAKIFARIPSTEFGSYTEPTNDGGYIVGATSASRLWAFKLDGSGAQQWERYIASGTGITAAYSVKQTKDNGYIIAGADMVTTTTDSIGNHGIRDFLVLKLDKDGKIEWMKALGGSLNEEASSIAQTPDGGYIVVGYTGSNDGQVTGWHGNSDYWVVKLDASGDIMWQKALGGVMYDYATCVSNTSDGGYIVAGYSGSKDGDVTGTHWGGSDDDVWVVKLDASGNISWQKSYGGTKEDRAYSIAQTTDGGYIVAGETTSNDGIVTGKRGTSYDHQDCWILKLDATGTLVWQRTMGGIGHGIGAGSGNDIAYSIKQTSDGGYVYAGTVSSGDSVNEDISGYHGKTGSDYWVVKLDASGNTSWQKCLGGTGTEDVKTIAQTPDGGYIVAGSSVYSNNGDVNSADYSDSHPWLVKLGGSASAVKDVMNSAWVAIYPNPARDKVTFDNIPANATLRITDVMGKTVYMGITNSTTETITTSDMSDGLYVARIESEGGVYQAKFLVCK